MEFGVMNVTWHGFLCAAGSGLFLPAQSSLLDSVRFASKKSGGSSKNVGGKSPGQRYGFKKQDGNNKSFETTSHMCCTVPSRIIGTL